MKGGFQPGSRSQQHWSEVVIGVGTYENLDKLEDQVVEALVSLARGLLAAVHAAADVRARVEKRIDELEAAWRNRDHAADRSVAELRELAIEAQRLVQATA